jgi:hypothetical protein
MLATLALVLATPTRSPEPSSSWLEWAGWDFIGTCAEVLALATLVAALYQWLRLRRRYPPVTWEIGTPAIGNTGDGRIVYRIHVTNAGRATAHIRSVYVANASVSDLVNSPQIQWFVRSAESFEFDVFSDDIANAWTAIVSTSLEDNQLMRVAWYALQPGTELADEQVASYVRSLPRGLKGWWVRRHPGAVGPTRNGIALIRLPRFGVWEVPAAVLEVINMLDSAELMRPGTKNVGDPKTWVGVPAGLKGTLNRTKPPKGA